MPFDAFEPYSSPQSNWLFKDLSHLWRCLIPWGEHFYIVFMFRASCDFSGAHLDDVGTCPTFRLLAASSCDCYHISKNYWLPACIVDLWYGLVLKLLQCSRPRYRSNQWWNWSILPIISVWHQCDLITVCNDKHCYVHTRQIKHRSSWSQVSSRIASSALGSCVSYIKSSRSGQ